MSLITSPRILNGIFWLWMWLSSVMMPITADTDNYWTAKVSQLFSLNPNIQDTPRLIGNAILPLILWFILDRILKSKVKAKSQSTTD